MTASLPPGMAPAAAPSALEMLWERHKRSIQAIFWLLVLGMFGYYALRFYQQTQVDKQWTGFSNATLLSTAYSADTGADLRMFSSYESVGALLDAVRDTTDDHFDRALAAADASQKPYLLWLKACRAAKVGDVEGATKVIGQLKAEYPNHTLCTSTPYPVQARDPVETKKKDKKPEAADEEPELKPAVAGSPADMLLQNLKAAKEFGAPTQFVAPTVPADAPRYRITLDGEYGSFVIALLPAAAPKLSAKFEELAAKNFWDGVKVDEIVRPSAKKNRFMEPLRQFHFGFESTKTEANRADWDTTTASKEENTVEEFTSLSHFPGAVAARMRDGKCEVDRLYVCESDSPGQDEQSQVFAFVVEGLENVRKVCDASFDRAEDEEVGRGKPAENIAIKSVTKL